MAEAKKNDTKAVTKYKGKVISPFKVKKTVYSIGDEYVTTEEVNYNILLKSKRIK
jgi:hypothetical protein